MMILSSGDSGGSESCSPGAPRAFWLIFLPLLSTAQILSFINIDWEGEGAARLELSSGVAFIQGSQGTPGTSHTGTPSTPNAATSCNQKHSPRGCPFLFCSPAKSFFQPFPINVFPLGAHGIPALGFLLSGKGKLGSAHPKVRTLCFAFLPAQVQVDLVPCVP